MASTNESSPSESESSHPTRPHRAPADLVDQLDLRIYSHVSRGRSRSLRCCSHDGVVRARSESGHASKVKDTHTVVVDADNDSNSTPSSVMGVQSSISSGENFTPHLRKRCWSRLRRRHRTSSEPRPGQRGRERVVRGKERTLPCSGKSRPLSATAHSSR